MTIIQGLIASMGASAPPPPPPPDVIDAQYYSDNDSWYCLGGSLGGGTKNNLAAVQYTYPGGSSGYVLPFTNNGEYFISPNLSIGNQTWSTNAITIDIWFYPTANGTQLMSELGSNDISSGYHYSVFEIASDGYLWAHYYNGTPLVSSNTVTLNAWNHVWFTEDTQGGHSFELNGVATGIQNPVYYRSKPSVEAFVIGSSDVTNMGKASTPFQGKISDINIHDYVASSTYAATRSKYVIPPMLLNLDVSNTSSYPGTGTTWYNLVPGGHDATFNSTPTVVNQGSKSIDFAGTNWATLPADIWFDQDFTIVAWVRLHSYANWERIIDFGNGAGVNNVLLAASSGTAGTPALRSEGTQFITSTQISLNTWTQVVGRVNMNLLGTVFINGSAVYNYSGMTIPPSITRVFNYIGKSNWADALLNGEIGELQIYHGALTDPKILEYYNATKSKYPNTYTFATIHSADGSSNDRFGGFSVIDAGQPAPQVGWTITDGTSTATVTGVVHQNSAVGFVYTLAISVTLSNTVDSVALTGL